jgi:SEC-C motif
MNIGRNDLCHCGSGKKYKKCCLAKDEEAVRRDAAKPRAPIPPQAISHDHDGSHRSGDGNCPHVPPDLTFIPASEPDPYFEEWDERWEKFEAADYEEQIALFTQTLNSPPSPLAPALVAGMDDEMAFRMLNELFFQTIKRDERDRFDALTESLRERDTRVYQENAEYILDWRITNALVSGRFDLAAALIRKLAPIAHLAFDTWNQVRERMAYYGQLPALIEAMRLSWPSIRESREIKPLAISEYRAQCAHLETLSYLQEAPEPQIENPAFQERLRFFMDEDENFNYAQQSLWIDCLVGRNNHPWTLDDFKIELHIQPQRNDEEILKTLLAGEPNHGLRNLSNLTAQFIHYLHKEEGTSYVKAELARDEIYTLIAKREMNRRRPGQARKRESPGNPLALSSQDLEARLELLLESLIPSPYKAAALMESAPAWMRFLESQQLIDADLCRRRLHDFEPIADNLIETLDRDSTDPRISLALKRQAEIRRSDLLL